MIVRKEPTADDSLAAMRARSKFGMAIAAMIKMIATTINNSINEKPFCLLMIFIVSPLKFGRRHSALLEWRVRRRSGRTQIHAYYTGLVGKKMALSGHPNGQRVRIQGVVIEVPA